MCPGRGGDTGYGKGLVPAALAPCVGDGNNGPSLLSTLCGLFGYWSMVCLGLLEKIHSFQDWGEGNGCKVMMVLARVMRSTLDTKRFFASRQEQLIWVEKSHKPTPRSHTLTGRARCRSRRRAHLSASVRATEADSEPGAQCGKG
jgi:hypothetical protein